jgi:hypothetical protein
MKGHVRFSTLGMIDGPDVERHVCFEGVEVRSNLELTRLPVGCQNPFLPTSRSDVGVWALPQKRCQRRTSMRCLHHTVRRDACNNASLKQS